MKTLVRALAALSLSVVATAALAQDRQQTPAPSQQEATQTPQATPPADANASAVGKAVVIVYRPGKLVGKALEPSVYCDGAEVARMDNGRYFVLLLEPGEHRIHTTEEYKRVDVKLGAGEVAFVRFKLEMGMMKGRGNVYLADEADAFKALKKMKTLDADKIKNTTLVVADKAQAEALLKKYVP